MSLTKSLVYCAVFSVFAGFSANAAYDPVNPADYPEIGDPAAVPWMEGGGTELIGNGSFETGDLSDWLTFNEGSGEWFVTDQPIGPVSGNPLQPPSDGTYQAVADQVGPSLQILYQDVTIPAGATAALNLVYWIENYEGVYTNPGHLDWENEPNQHCSIDIMDPASAVDTNDGVLLNILVTDPGFPPSVPPTPLNADLSAFAGQTVRLRFVDVDNVFFLTFGIDAVSVIAEGATPTEQVTWGRVKHAYK